jgi:aerobic carbon-monoxide dehydrogenase medium subunit
MLAQFDFILPDSLDEALSVLAKNAKNGTVSLAGGTNLVVDMRAGRESPTGLVGLTNIAELRYISMDADSIAMGAGTTVSDILNNAELCAAAPSLAEAAGVFAGMMVRNTATIAGNVCCGSPAADLMPPLLALDAELKIASASGKRSLPLSEFYVGFKENQLKPDELVTEISFPVPAPGSVNLFYKLARRKGDAITVTGVAVAVEFDGDTCSAARIVLGAVAPTVMRSSAAEEVLIGNKLTPELIAEAAEKAVADASPIDDVRASADYRRHCVGVLTRRLLTQALDTKS